MPSASTDIPSVESTDLMVASRIIGCECADVNKAFLQCKSNDANPQACLNQGERVTGCVMKVLRTLDTECRDTFRAYKKAMDDRWHEVDQCRKEQYAMEDCWRNFKQPPSTKDEL